MYAVVGLIKSFGESRSTVNDFSPNVPGDAADDPLVNVFDYGTSVDEVIDRMTTDNDKPPYETDAYPGDDANMPKPLVVQDTILVDGKGSFRIIPLLFINEYKCCLSFCWGVKKTILVFCTKFSELVLIYFFNSLAK